MIYVLFFVLQYTSVSLLQQSQKQFFNKKTTLTTFTSHIVTFDVYFAITILRQIQ